MRCSLFYTTFIILIINSIKAKCFDKMKAVGYYKNLPSSDEDFLLDLVVDKPEIGDSDVLVEIKAVSVNPIEIKLRLTVPALGGKPRILGSDGSGIVVAKGNNVKKFNVGDEVFFVGDLRRNGTNSQYVAVDEILVGLKPKKLSFEEAAAMPLTSMTAYDSIYNRLLISEKDKGKTLLIINSAGGVGSIASQLAKNLGLTVIGTASRPETEAFTRKNGADIVLNHRKDLKAQLAANGYANGVDFILVNYDPLPYWDTLMNVIKAQGKICLIVTSSGLVDVTPMLQKSVTLSSEMLFTRLIYNSEDKYILQDILADVSKMLDSGKLNTTVKKTLSPINAANLKEAHKLLEKQSLLGKLVISGF